MDVGILMYEESRFLFKKASFQESLHASMVSLHVWGEKPFGPGHQGSRKLAHHEKPVILPFETEVFLLKSVRMQNTFCI